MMKRSEFKRKSPKKRAGHDKDMLLACRGEDCYLRIPGVCIGGYGTVVPAHSNQSRHGKGMGVKSNDEFTVPSCFACHYEIDQGKMFTKEQKFEIWDLAYTSWSKERDIKLAQK